ncbi:MULTISPECIES: alpha/beta hydrolase [unclassified Arenibacter]|uniref:alpha/beta hydrolase n=1 Tax=unclassified Arenibacter TaxID=2615047 RepID=UPI000E34E32C|nr:MULTISPECIES: alpha/beta hydrolase [unclassified Arenibacter]MCM4164223.1 alpha/beta hydrolase [Arenibacter sp. A80]RFT56016.1 alpha/beta hydrolase [Arenibacter sp. P308M17]
MIKNIFISLFTLILVLGCKAKQYDESEPPKGYSSNTTLKLAYTTGALKLIEKDFPLPEDIQEYKDVVYKTVDSMQLKLDIYHSKDIQKTMPLIIFIHGGAWKKGNKHDYLVYLSSYAKKGFVTATIQYRLTDVAKFPAQLHDVEDAVRWLKLNAANYHIDASKVALVGGSAGGHLAMLNAYSNTPEEVDTNGISANVQAVVNFYGPSNLTDETAINASSVQYLIGKSYEEAPEMYKKASPLFLISKKVPPTLTFQGTLDELVPYEQSDILHATLQKAGAISYYHKLKGWPHTMDASVKVNAYCQYHMDRFFEKYIPLN